MKERLREEKEMRKTVSQHRTKRTRLDSEKENRGRKALYLENRVTLVVIQTAISDSSILDCRPLECSHLA